MLIDRNWRKNFYCVTKRKDHTMKFFLLSLLMAALSGCSKQSAEEMFNKGADAQKAERYDAAIISYQELIETYPDSSRTPEAYYAIATIYQNHKRFYHQAIQTFRQLIEKYPTHATASSASFLIGFIYNNDLKNIDSARIAYEDFIKRYPTNQLVTSAQFELTNLGKDPAEILKVQSQLAQEETKPIKKGKKK
jgi:TolA-binding protein